MLRDRNKTRPQLLVHSTESAVATPIPQQQPVLAGYKKPAVGVTKMPPSIYVVKHYGIPLSWMRAAMVQQWNIQWCVEDNSQLADGVTANDVVSSFLHKWDSKYAYDQASKGYITKDGKQYLVVYHGVTRRQLQNYEKVLLSFRCAAPEYELAPMVLIKPFYTTPADINSEVRED